MNDSDRFSTAHQHISLLIEDLYAADDDEALIRLKVALGCMLDAVQTKLDALESALPHVPGMEADAHAQLAAARRAYYELGPRGDERFDPFDYRHLGGFKAGDPVWYNYTPARIRRLGRDGMHAIFDSAPGPGYVRVDYRNIKHRAE